MDGKKPLSRIPGSYKNRQEILLQLKLHKSPIIVLDFKGKILVHTLAFSACLHESEVNSDSRAEVAQLVEHSPEKAGVRSSILRLGTTIYLIIGSSFILSD